MEKILSEYVIHYYALKKYNGMKSTVDYVSPSARKLNIVLTSDSEAQESEVFMTLQNNLTARLEEFRIEITRNSFIKKTLLQFTGLLVCQRSPLLPSTVIGTSSICTRHLLSSRRNVCGTEQIQM